MPSSFGSRLRGVRDALKLTQIAMADKVKVHRRTIGNWETGGDIPSFHTAMRIASELDVSPYYLAGLSDFQRPGRLANDERELINLYRALPQNEKAMWRESMRDAGSIERISRKAKAL